MGNETNKESEMCRNKNPRRYDIIDLMLISIFEILIFSAGLGLGWLLWNR